MSDDDRTPRHWPLWFIKATLALLFLVAAYGGTYAVIAQRKITKAEVWWATGTAGTPGRRVDRPATCAVEYPYPWSEPLVGYALEVFFGPANYVDRKLVSAGWLGEF